MNPRPDGDSPDTVDFPPAEDPVAKFFEPEPRARARVDVAGKTHPGRVRPNNEDNFLVVKRYRGREILATSLPREILDTHEDHAFLFAVADGMGGHSFGELASLLAMRTGWELGDSEIKWAMKMNPHEVEEMDEKAQTFFQLIDEAIRAEIRESPRLAGMGTTLTICYSTGDRLFVMHVGDSRAYLHRDGKIHRLTRDHNLAQVLVDAGKADPDSWEARRVRHVLTNALGSKSHKIHVELHHQALRHGDRLLLCSDGLNDRLQDGEMEAILNENLESTHACNALLAKALERGAPDNVTVVVAGYRIEQDAGGSGKRRSIVPD